MRARGTYAAVLVALGGALAACGGGTQAARPIANVTIPVEAPPAEPPQPPAPAREAPPEGAPPHDVPFPVAARMRLANGFEVATLRRGTLPLAHLRLALPTGSAADGERTGVARLTALALVEAGAGRSGAGEFAARLDAMGGTLRARVEPDFTLLSLDVARERLDDALDLLGAAVREPRFDEAEIARIRRREVDRAAELSSAEARRDAPLADALAWRELFQLPTGAHPYASHEPTAGELAKVEPRLCREHWRRVGTPKGAILAVAGDVDAEAVQKGAERAFGAWKGGEPAPSAFAEATPPERPRIVLADRPRSAEVELRIAALGPVRRDERWADAAVLASLLGGADGRLARALGGERRLATQVGASLEEVARGPAPLVLRLTTTPELAGRAVQAVVDELRRLATEAPSAGEVEAARRALRGRRAVDLATAGALAGRVATLRALGLGDDQEDALAAAIAAVAPDGVQAAAAEHLRDGHLVIVATGAADRVAARLARFGEVRVVDPARGFERTRSVPATPDAPLE